MKINLNESDNQDASKLILGKHEEKAIISLAFDQPEFFSSVIGYIKDDFFNLPESIYVFRMIKHYYEKHDIVLSRELCCDIAKDLLTADDPHEEILGTINRKSNPRELPIVQEKISDWARNKAYGLLYSEESLNAHERGDYDKIEEIIENARKILNVGTQCHFFFKEIDELFVDEQSEKMTCGFPQLDSIINCGGPMRKEVFIWMAPTNGSKSCILCNTAIANVKAGRNVLYVTLEMTFKKTAQRMLGIFSNYTKDNGLWIKNRNKPDVQAGMRKAIDQTRNSGAGELILCEFAADDVSVDAIHNVLDVIRKSHGINIDVVVIDYLELLLSRNAAYNKEEYIKQKRVSTEMARLAKKEDVLVFSATQTNRSGNDGKELIDINKVSESYGKTMAIEYLVSINQTQEQYKAGEVNVSSLGNRYIDLDSDIPNTGAECTFYIVKNRNGKKFIAVNCKINYMTMRAMEKNELSR